MNSKLSLRAVVAGGAVSAVALAAESAITALAVKAVADAPYFDTGRFIADTGEVRRGVFGSGVIIDYLVVGEGSFRSRFDELIEVAAARVYIEDADGSYGLLTDEDIVAGNSAVGLAIARDLDSSRFTSVLDAIQGQNLGHMLRVDGSANVRIDVWLTVALYDSSPGEADMNPEALLIGNASAARIAAIVGGNPDEPILGPRMAEITPDHFERGRTGINMLMQGQNNPVPIGIVGFDLFEQLGVEAGGEARGYRIEVPAGSPGFINILGSGNESQRVLGGDLRIIDDPEDLELGLVGGWGGVGGGGGAWGGGFAGGRDFGTGGGIRGNGNGPRGPGPRSPRNDDDPPDDNIDLGHDSGNPAPPEPPVVPAPGTLAVLGLSWLLAPSRRRR